MTDDDLIDCLVSKGVIQDSDSAELKEIMSVLPNQEWLLLKLLVALNISQLP